VKVDRYFITILPVIAYFAAYSLDYLIKTFINRNNMNMINNKNDENNENEKNNKNNKNYRNYKNNKNSKNSKNSKILNNIIPMALIIIFSVSAFVNVGTIPSENELIEEPIIVSNWLMDYDPNYYTKNIWVYNDRFFTWYLKMNVMGAYEKDIPNFEKHNVSYFISKNISEENYTIENYTIIKKFNDVYIYKRNK